MLLFAASILTIVTIASLFIAGQTGVLVAMFSKPIIDATWDSSFGGFNLLQIVAIAFPALILIRSIASQGNSITHMPLHKIWMVHIAYTVLTFLFFAMEKSIVNWVDSTFRLLNGLAGYYILQAQFRREKEFRRLLTVLILAGLFPMFMGLYQALTGTIWREHLTVGLVRYNGLYHDIVAVRMFAFQTLTAIVLYWAYFLPKGRSYFLKCLFLAFALLCVFVIYKAYSKAAVALLAAWFLIWTISYRRILPTIGVILLSLIVMSVYSEEIFKEIEQLFSKELAVTDISVDSEEFNRSFAGRWYFWVKAVEDYSDRGFLGQLFGNGNSANIHNEFLGKLLSGGIVGLVIYLILLFLIAKKLISNWKTNRSPLNVMGLMVFSMIIIDSFGVIVTVFTTYQWYAWGFVGLALRGLEFGEAKEAKASNRPPVGILQRKQWA